MGLYKNIQRATNIVPEELTVLNQWVVWRYQWSEEENRWKKPPVDPTTGKLMGWKNFDNWLTYDEATLATEEYDYGIGFVLTPEDPLSFIDLDDVIDPDTGEIEQWAMEVVDSIDSYTEISPSGTGLRIAVRGSLELPDGKGKV